MPAIYEMADRTLFIRGSMELALLGLRLLSALLTLRVDHASGHHLISKASIYTGFFYACCFLNRVRFNSHYLKYVTTLTCYRSVL